MLKFLGAKGSPSHSRCPTGPNDVRVRLNVPNYGAVSMIAQRIDDGTTDTPQYADRELSGSLDIHVPQGSGRRRVRAIRLRLVQVCRLYMGEKRGWEKDTLFERTTENRGAILLEEGYNRFAFTILVPYALAPFSIHPTGDIKLTLLAEVEGLTGTTVPPSIPPTLETTESMRSVYGRRGSRWSDSTSGDTTPSVSEEDGPPGINIQPLMTMSWCDPVASGDASVEWLKGTRSGSRLICLLYNPDEDNGITSLDMHRDGSVEGIGAFEMIQTSDVWTVCALLRSQLKMPGPGPDVAMYYIRTVLEQTATMCSPRDRLCTPPTVSMQSFVIWEKGVKPRTKMVPANAPAIWRGMEAGGKDSGCLELSGFGRLPNDQIGRPSTLDGIITPIRMTHKLVMEVFYSVKGLDVHGKPLPKSMKGAEARLLRIEKPVIVPSCRCIPEWVDLPSYNEVDCDIMPCPTCGKKPEFQICRVCPLSSVPHARHDLYDQFGRDGTCPECENRFIHTDEAERWNSCACGFSIAHLHQRMARVIPEEVECVGDCVSDVPPKYDYQ